MKHSFYPFRASEDALSFTFKSISEKRIILKKAEFVKISDNVYNFAFGDVNTEGRIDDLVVTNNQDSETVFATVIRILLVFLKAHNSDAVYFEGSTPSRTRMYQIILTKERVNWEQKFVVYGFCGDELETFETDCRYDAFIIKLKH